MKTFIRTGKLIFFIGFHAIVFMEIFNKMNISFYITFLFIFIPLYSYKVKIKIDQGVVIGVKKNTVFNQKWYFAFYAVPYAKAPIGRLRFKNPKPIKRFSKTLDASTEYHGACAQTHIVHKKALYGQEDCLHLNIYTPYLPEEKYKNLKPVIVWIHGYAFTSSFSHVYGPDFLIENDIIFISLTHRIGVFGFLKLNESDSTGNMGLNDIIIGLKWIRSNVKYFGGDKDKITLMGSGSGGTFAALLLLTKHRSLFQKLIIQSGSMFSASLFQGVNYLERDKLKREIKKEGYKDYKTAAVDALVTASNKIYSSNEVINLQRPLVPFIPLIEKKMRNSLAVAFVFDEYENVVSNNYNIPILTGFTTQESISEVIPFIHNQSYLKSLGLYFKYMVPFSNGCTYNSTTKTYKSVANRIIKEYFKNYPDIILEEFLKYTSDIHKYPMYKFIKTQVLHNNRNLFVYKFNYNGKFNVMKSTSLAGMNTRVKGSAHGDELCYLLKCEPLWEEYEKIKSDVRNQDRIFMNEIVTMWANFAKFGNPTPVNYKGNITWLPMTLKQDNLLLFQNTRNILIDSRTEAQMYTFWNKLYEDYYSQRHCNDVHDEL